MAKICGKNIPCSEDPFEQGKNGFISNNPSNVAGFSQTYQSLTDKFQPKEQYTRKLYQVATGDDNVLDEHVERLSRKLEARGEQVHLIKRKLDGERCNCYDPVMQVLRRKYCLQCYGTRIKKGYELYKNINREDGKIIIAAPFAEAKVDWQEHGRIQTEDLLYWTLPWVPLENGSAVYSYDWLIRYNNDGTELGRYYIHDVKPSRAVDNYITYQHFTAGLATRPTHDQDNELVRRGDLIYSINIEDLDVVEAHLEKGADGR